MMPAGRPRVYPSDAARLRAWRQRRRVTKATPPLIQPGETKFARCAGCGRETRTQSIPGVPVFCADCGPVMDALRKR